MSMIYEDSYYGIKGLAELEREANENGLCFAYIKRIDFDKAGWGPANYEAIIRDMTAKDNLQVGKQEYTSPVLRILLYFGIFLGN